MSILEKAKTMVGVYADNDIRSKLQADHKIFKELLKEACEATPAKRIEALKQFKPLLVAHARAEEAVVYSPMVKRRKSPDSRDHGNEGFVEHSLVDALLAQIAATRPAGSDRWNSRIKVLREMLEHHIDEEEKDVFEELGEHFSDQQREQMATDFEGRKAALLGKTRFSAARKTTTKSTQGTQTSAMRHPVASAR